MRIAHGKARADHGHAQGVGQYLERFAVVMPHAEHGLPFRQPHFAPVAVLGDVHPGGRIELEHAAIGQMHVQLLAARAGKAFGIMPGRPVTVEPNIAQFRLRFNINSMVFFASSCVTG